MDPTTDEHAAFEANGVSAVPPLHPAGHVHRDVEKGGQSRAEIEKSALNTDGRDGDHDIELAEEPSAAPEEKKSVYQNLGWLDRLLALWILLAIIIGIIIGNFAEGAEEALQEGKFVNVSVPVGM